MNSKGPYQIHGFSYQGGYLEAEAEAERETLADAKRHARHLLSDEYRQLSEASHRLGYARVLNAAGESVADYFNDKNILCPMLAVVP